MVHLDTISSQVGVDSFVMWWFLLVTRGLGWHLEVCQSNDNLRCVAIISLGSPFNADSNAMRFREFELNINFLRNN